MRHTTKVYSSSASSKLYTFFKFLALLVHYLEINSIMQTHLCMYISMVVCTATYMLETRACCALHVIVTTLPPPSESYIHIIRFRLKMFPLCFHVCGDTKESFNTTHVWHTVFSLYCQGWCIDFTKACLGTFLQLACGWYSLLCGIV